MLILHHGKNYLRAPVQPAGSAVFTAPKPYMSAQGVVTRTGTATFQAPMPSMVAAGAVTRTGTATFQAPMPYMVATNEVSVDLTTGLLEYIDLVASPWTSNKNAISPTVSGTGSIGTRSGPGGAANAMDLTAADGQYLTYANAVVITTTTGGMAFSWWRYYDSGGNYPSSLRVGSVSYTPPFCDFVETGGTHKVRIFIGGIQRDITVSPVAGWNHFLVQHNPDLNRVEVYINNGTPVTHATTGAFQTGTFNVACGFLNGTVTWDGGIGRVGIYQNRYFDADHRAALYNSGNGRLYSAL